MGWPMKWKAQLIRPDGTVEKEWVTDNQELAKTAARNYPPGWTVKVTRI